MYQVLIMATDLFEVEEEVDKTIAFTDFYHLTATMQEAQFIRYQLIAPTGFPIYTDSYLFHDPTFTLELSIKAKLKSMVKEKQLTRRAAKDLLVALFSKNDRHQLATGNDESAGTIVKLQTAVPLKNKFSYSWNLVEFFQSNRKRSFVGVALFLLMVLVLVGGPKIWYSFFSQPPTFSQKEAFQQDLDKLTPLELGKKYPNRLVKIADYYAQNQKFKLLRTFNQNYPTDGAAFDLSFYDKEWKAVIHSAISELTEERKVMFAHAYVMLDQLEQAEIINKQLKSQLITEEIDRQYVERGVQLLRDKKVEEAEKVSKHLSTETCKQAFQQQMDNAKILIELIQFYNAAGDEQNKQLWERKLQDLGKEIDNVRS